MSQLDSFAPNAAALDPFDCLCPAYTGLGGYCARCALNTATRSVDVCVGVCENVTAIAVI